MFMAFKIALAAQVIVYIGLIAFRLRYLLRSVKHICLELKDTFSKYLSSE
jgi:hypothetical protein